MRVEDNVRIEVFTVATINILRSCCVVYHFRRMNLSFDSKVNKSLHINLLINSWVVRPCKKASENYKH